MFGDVLGGAISFVGAAVAPMAGPLAPVVMGAASAAAKAVSGSITPVAAAKGPAALAPIGLAVGGGGSTPNKGVKFGAAAGGDSHGIGAVEVVGGGLLLWGLSRFLR